MTLKNDNEMLMTLIPFTNDTNTEAVVQIFGFFES